MGTLNIHSGSNDWRAKRLSNFSDDPVYLDGVWTASVEGFIQGIKFPHDHPFRQRLFLADGARAKRLGKMAGRKFVWWQCSKIPYGSPKHHRLIERAIRAKFRQNDGPRRALLETEGLTLTHNLGHPESPTTSLPAAKFCEILTNIREEELKKEKAAADAEAAERNAVESLYSALGSLALRKTV